MRERADAVAALRAGAAAFGAELDELTRVLHREEPQQDLVDEPEHRGVGADAERQGQHGHGCENRGLEQGSEGQADFAHASQTAAAP